MMDEFVQSPESPPSRDEESPVVHRSNFVMLRMKENMFKRDSEMRDIIGYHLLGTKLYNISSVLTMAMSPFMTMYPRLYRLYRHNISTVLTSSLSIIIPLPPSLRWH